MKKSEIANNRRIRTLHLINTYFKGNKTKFAEALSENSGKHIAVTIVHRWFWNNHQRRNIGESHARLIEDAFDLEYAWLDGFSNATLESNAEISEPQAEYFMKNTKPAKLSPVLKWEQIGNKELDNKAISEWFAGPHCADNAFYLRISGEQMLSPEGISFIKGTLILIDPTIETKTDDFVIAKVKGAENAIFRQLKEDEAGKPYLKPLNASFPIVFDEFTVVGKVVFSAYAFS